MLPEEERKQIIGLVQREVVPAIGCTEPIAVALCTARAAETLAQQGFVLTVAAREESAVQVLLTNAAGSAGDPAVLDAAMEAEGFTAADNNWYTYEEDINS